MWCVGLRKVTALFCQRWACLRDVLNFCKVRQLCKTILLLQISSHMMWHLQLFIAASATLCLYFTTLTSIVCYGSNHPHDFGTSESISESFYEYGTRHPRDECTRDGMSTKSFKLRPSLSLNSWVWTKPVHQIFLILSNAFALFVFWLSRHSCPGWRLADILCYKLWA